METVYLPISFLRDIIKTPGDVSVVLQDRWKYSGSFNFHRVKYNSIVVLQYRSI